MIRTTALITLIFGCAPYVLADPTVNPGGQVNVTTQQPATVTVTPTASPAAAPAPAVPNPNPNVSANPNAQVAVAPAPVANQDLAGTVQSVDRRNRSLVLQDNHGKDIGITFNSDWHVYRRGQEIQYRDVEPNDHVMLLYRAAS